MYGCYDRTIFGWDTTIEKSGIWGAEKSKYWEITFKIVQMKFLAMHIYIKSTIKFDIFTVGNLINSFMELIFI